MNKPNTTPTVPPEEGEQHEGRGHERISEAELAEIEERAGAATPAPWINHVGEFVSTARDNPAGSYMAICRVNRPVRADWRIGKTVDAGPESELPNKEFIAHARTDVPRLVNEVRCLRQASRANIEEELASVLLDTQVQLEEARPLIEAARAYQEAVQVILDTEAPSNADFREEERASEYVLMMARRMKPQPPVAQATVPETEGGREGEEERP